jgi:VanZ family protein
MLHPRSAALRWLPVLAWMLLIFIASSDEESGYRGSRILAPVIRWFVPDISAPDLERVVLLARKAVHFVTYATLATLAYRALRLSPSTPPTTTTRAAWTSWGIAVLYAVSDELHQSFVPSRVGSALDVTIDAAGAAFAVACLAAGGFWQPPTPGHETSDGRCGPLPRPGHQHRSPP